MATQFNHARYIVVAGRREDRHGHVIRHPDGLIARCGGPSMCPVCKAEEQELAFYRAVVLNCQPVPPLLGSPRGLV